MSMAQKSSHENDYRFSNCPLRNCVRTESYSWHVRFKQRSLWFLHCLAESRLIKYRQVYIVSIAFARLDINILKQTIQMNAHQGRICFSCFQQHLKNQRSPQTSFFGSLIANSFSRGKLNASFSTELQLFHRDLVYKSIKWCWKAKHTFPL